jgi:MFS family permease
MSKKNNVNALWNKSYIFLFMISILTSMGFNMVYVMISNYAMEINNSLAIAGVIAGIFSIAALVVRPFAGMSVDIFNKKNLCIIANILMGLSVLGYALSFTIPVLFFFRVLHGIAFGLSSTANIALVAEFIPKERLGEGIGYYGMGQVIAQVIGPNLGLYLADKIGFQSMFLMIAFSSFLAVVMMVFFSYPKTDRTLRKPRTKIRLESLIAKEVIVYAIIGGMFSFGNGIVNSFLILLGKERHISGVSIFFSVGALVLFVLRLFVGRIVDKQGLALVVNISLIITAISMVLIGIAPVLSLLIVAAVLKSIGQGTGQISLQTECIKSVDASRVGVATSTFFIGADIGQGVGPIIGGAISSCFNYTVMYVSCAVLVLVSMVVFNVYHKHIQNSGYKIIN